jgi:hypothetical protein
MNINFKKKSTIAFLPQQCNANQSLINKPLMFRNILNKFNTDKLHRVVLRKWIEYGT